MAECRCGTCEHCVTSPPVRPRKLLTRSQIRILRGSGAPDVDVVLDAYETAVRLLEEVVREERQSVMLPIGAIDVAWLALREAER